MSYCVPAEGIEPPHLHRYRNLKPARLPIPPDGRTRVCAHHIADQPCGRRPVSDPASFACRRRHCPNTLSRLRRVLSSDAELQVLEHETARGQPRRRLRVPGTGPEVEAAGIEPASVAVLSGILRAQSPWCTRRSRRRRAEFPVETHLIISGTSDEQASHRKVRRSMTQTQHLGGG